MEAPPIKRARADTAQQTHDTAQQTYDAATLGAWISQLPPQTTQSLLLSAAQQNPAIGAAIAQHIHAAQQAEQQRVLSFDKYGRSAWRELNEKYAHLSGSAEFDACFDAEAAVGRMLRDILRQVSPRSSYGTKRSAVETIRAIIESALLAEGQMGKEVCNSADWDDRFAEALGMMEEGEQFRLVTEEGGQWLEKLRGTVGLANDYCVFEGLGGELDELERIALGEDFDEEDDDDEDEEDYDEGGEEGEGENGQEEGEKRQ